MKNTDLLAWIDIETTGLDPLKDELLEVACIITDQELHEIARHHSVLNFNMIDDRVYDIYQSLPEVVQKMHSDSGLWLACLEQGIFLHHWVDEFEEFLRITLEENTFYKKFVMAGSGVARFDYTWFQFNYQKILEHFQYYCFDVGILRRGLVMAGAIEPLENKSLAHRAMTDIEDHLEEWKYYLSILPTNTERAWVPNEWRTADDNNHPFGG